MPIDFSKLKRRENLVSDAQASVEATSSKGVFSGIFDFSEVPFPIEQWKITEAAQDWELDILAQPIENPRNPLCRSEGMVAGEDWHFHVLLDVHEYVGGTTNDVVCLEQFGQKCPACKAFWEHHNAYNKGKDYEDPTRVKNPYGVSRRSFMLVRPRKNNPENKVFLFKAGAMLKPTPGFVPMLLSAANSTRGGKAPVNFAHPETGAVVLFDTTKGQKKHHFPALNFGFRERPASEGLELWKRSFALDTCIKIPTPGEMEEIMYNAPKAEEEPKEATSQGRRDDYRREVEDAPDTQATSRQDAPEADKAEADKGKKPETTEAEKPKATGSKTCPEGFTYGVTSVEENKRECRKCDLFDRCVDNK